MLEARQMLQQLLADRFQLGLRRELQDRQVLALVADKRGAKVKESLSASVGSIRFGSGEMAGSGTSMAQLALSLSNQVGSPVIDDTGLSGKFDFTLKWDAQQPTRAQEVNPSPADSTPPSIFSAIQEQLGLRLQSRRVQIEVLVVDHARKPSEN